MIKYTYVITYAKSKESGTHLHARFDDLESAQLFWDTIWYLRNEYLVYSGRPSLGE